MALISSRVWDREDYERHKRGWTLKLIGSLNESQPSASECSEPNEPPDEPVQQEKPPER